MVDAQVFVGADFGAAELYALAHVCKVLFGFSRMQDILRTGEDLHVATAAAMRGCTVQELRTLPNWKELRQLSKALNFGLPGGLGVTKLVRYVRGYGVVITETEGKRLKAQWLAAYPEVAAYLKWIGNKPNGWTSKHPITGFIRGGLGYSDGANHHFQHLIGWLGKESVFDVVCESYDESSPLFGWKPFGFVHDELLARGPLSGAVAAAERLGFLMEASAAKVLEVVPPAKPFITRVWSKDVEPAYDADGRVCETRVLAEYHSADKLSTSEVRITDAGNMDVWLGDSRVYTELPDVRVAKRLAKELLAA